MKNILRLQAIVLFLFSSQFTIGQTSNVKGLISDKLGIPLIGASITIDNSNSGTITDRKGHYTIWLSPGRHYISLSYVGYATRTILIEVKKKSLERNFTMCEDYKDCEEVIVTAPRNRNNNSVSKNSYPDQSKSTEVKSSSRQLELPLLNNVLDY